MIDLNEKLVGVKRTIKSSVRPDNDTPKADAISVYLELDYSDCTLNDVLTFASADRRIAWATTGRKNCGTLTAGETIRVKAGAPATRSVDPKASTLSWASTADPEEVAEYIKQLKARAKKQ
jgi:hypothetical protein